MLCLISITYQEKTNLNLSIKTAAATAFQTGNGMRSGAKATTAAITDLRSKAKMTNAAKAKSVMESLLEAKNESAAAMESSSETKTTGGIPTGWIMIKGRGNKCIKAHTNGMGNYIKQGNCDGSLLVQWKLVKYGGRYKIQNRKGIEVSLYHYTRSTNTYLYGYNKNNSRTNQQWYIQSVGGGRYRFKNYYSHKCIYNPSPTTLNYNYRQYPCSGASNQQFSFIKVKTHPIPTGWVQIMGSGGKCIRVYAHGHYVKQHYCNRSYYVQLRLVKYGGRYKVQNKSGVEMSLYYYRRYSNAYVYGYNRNNSRTNQQWTFEAIGIGQYRIRNYYSKKCLYNPSPTSQGYVYRQYTCSNAASQKFAIMPLKSTPPPTGWVMIQNSSHLCIKSSTHGNVHYNRKCNKANSMMFRFIKVGGRYRIQAKNGVELSIYHWTKNNGHPIYGYNKNNSRSNQQWILESIGGGYYRFKNYYSKKCIYNPYPHYTNQYHRQTVCRGYKNQRFRLIGKKMKSPPVPKGWVMIKGSGNKCIRVYAAGHYVKQWTCNRSYYVMLRLVKYGGRWKVQNKSGIEMSLYYYRRYNNAYVYGYNRNNSRTNQQWTFEAIGGGKFRIRNYYSHKCLYNPSPTSQGYVYRQYSCSSASNQKFSFVEKPKKVDPKGWVMIKGIGNMCMKAHSSGMGNYIKQGNCNRSYYVMWKFVKIGRRFKMQNKKGIEVSLYHYTKSTNTYLYGYNKNNSRTNQQWHLQKISGKYRFKNHYSKKCIYNPSPSSLNSIYRQYPCSTATNQQFRIMQHGKSIQLPFAKKIGISLKTKKNKRKMKYRKKKTLKFMKGKYKFNLNTGNAFCSSKCKNNSSAKERVCFFKGTKRCKSCSFKGNKKTVQGKKNHELCSIVCRSINNQSCKFFAYSNNKKKVINRGLLNKFGKIFAKKYLRKRR